MVAISDRGVPDKAIQKISPEELKTLTKATYTSYKEAYIEQHKTFTSDFSKQEYHYPLAEYIERLEYELKVIKEMGYNTYMLVVSDFTTRAKENGIMVWPGRWSGAGSLLAFLTSITDINPFAYDLLFERFLNPARISMPDFDIDFEDKLRENVIQYVADKYGHNHVAAIGTYMTMATKAAFKDAARAIGIPFDKSNEVTKLMGDLSSLKQIIDGDKAVSGELLTLYNQDSNIQDAIIKWDQLEGNLRQLGVHACGMIISPEPVTEYTATQIVNKWWIETLVTQYDGPTLENIGLLKMDFLWLRNLSVIKNCIKILRAKYKDITTSNVQTLSEKNYLEDKWLFDEFIETMSFNPDLDSKEVFEKVFMAGDTTWIFQFEGEGMRRFLVELEPNHINDLVAMNALYRPWPMEFIPSYIKRKHGQEEVTYMLPELRTLLLAKYKNDQSVIASEQAKLEEDLKPIMDITYGIAVYQEQLMFLVQAMAWFSLPEADLLRRGVGKKIKKIIEELKSEFTERAQSFRGYKPETAIFIYEKMIEPAASYSFNKSHSVCYAHIAYQNAYLKARYPLEFYASLLRSVEEDTDRLSVFIDEVHAHNIRIEWPHINHAYNHIAATDNHITMGFYACKGLGFEIGEKIEKERRTNGVFSSLENFLERCPFVANKRTLESLIKAGAFDHRYDRNTLLLNLNSLIERHHSVDQLDQWLFGGLAASQQLQFQETSTTSSIEKTKYEIEIFKNMISWHPLDGLYIYNKRFGLIDTIKKHTEPAPFSCMAMVKKITRARRKWFFILVEDTTDSFEFFVKDKPDFEAYDILLIEGYKSRNRTVQTIIKVDIEEFIERAKRTNKYDPEWTVAKVRLERNPQQITMGSTISLEDDEIEQVIDTDRQALDTSTTWEVPKTSTINTSSSWPTDHATQETETTISNETQTNIIDLPPSLDMIKKISDLIKTHPGTDHTIYIQDKEYTLSDKGYHLLQNLLRQ